MKDFAKIFASSTLIFGLVFLFGACNKSHDKDKKTETSIDNSKLTGVWVVTNAAGDQFEITLNKDGTATSTWKVLDKGKWIVVSQQKANIQWDNGSNEFIIVDESGEGERQTFAPGQSTTEKPTEVTKIKKK